MLSWISKASLFAWCLDASFLLNGRVGNTHSWFELDLQAADLLDGLASQQQARSQRAERIAVQLARHGFVDAMRVP